LCDSFSVIITTLKTDIKVKTSNIYEYFTYDVVNDKSTLDQASSKPIRKRYETISPFYVNSFSDNCQKSKLENVLVVSFTFFGQKKN
jgi:hypothetical protein